MEEKGENTTNIINRRQYNQESWTRGPVRIVSARKKTNTHTSPESPDTDCEQIVNVATSVCETQHF